MDPIQPTDNKASIALLRLLRAGERVHFVHLVDVCDAVPEALLADLQPVPGTCHDEDGGYSSVWYCYCAKKFTNKQGKLSGYRQRAVTGGGGTSWHSEISRREVQGSGGGTFCNLSYGRKTDPSSNSIDRMGWCMVEYDLKEQGDAANSNYVLCKVYRSSRAKGKMASTSTSASASASSSSNKKNATKQKGKKRKAGGGEHPEAPPAKVIQHQQEPEQEEVQQETAEYCDQLQLGGVGSEHGHDGDFFNDFNIDDINFYVDVLQGAMPEPGLQQQQPIVEAPPQPAGHGGDEFIQMPCGPVVPAVPEAMFEDMLGPGPPETTTTTFSHDCSGGGGGEFIQMPCGPAVPVVPEAMFEAMLGAGPEMTTATYGQWSGGMATASIPCPWSSSGYAPTMSSASYTPCSSLLLHHQGQDRSLLRQLPYLMC